MTQIRALRGGAVGHRNRNSRLIILGGMMAMLYFLFMTLSFNVMGGATQHQQPKAPPRPPPAHADTKVQPRAQSNDGPDVAKPTKTDAIGSSESPGPLRKGPISGGAQLRPQPADPASPAVETNDAADKILGGRAMRRNFAGEGEGVSHGSVGAVFAVDDDGGDHDEDVPDEVKNDTGLDDGRAEEGVAPGDKPGEQDAGQRPERRNFVKPAGINVVDDDGLDDDQQTEEREDVGDGERQGNSPFGREALSEGARPMLKAYIETIDQTEWKIKPLPIRKTTSSKLEGREYPRVTSCQRLTEQFPVDEPPTVEDPFLPWIHDVFPSEDGKFIQFVAQNRRRCHSGKDHKELKKFQQPNIALFQHIPVKRVDGELTPQGETRYRLASHEDADPDGMETRFICRFKPSGQETLSVFDFDYDYHTYRKSYSSTFTEEGFDNHMIWTSQLLFKCPVPPDLVEQVKSGESVINDYATLFVDLVPIRTPPRYGKPTQFRQPRYRNDPMPDKPDEVEFDADVEWGKEHVLPRLQDSGRWENVPICKPSLAQYVDSDAEDGEKDGDKSPLALQERSLGDKGDRGKRWKAIACTWSSASFYTRGDARHITDNVRRLREWAEFHFMTGLDHIVLYDNSEAQEGTFDTLEPVTKLFPGKITRINWPSKVCNNRPGTGDDKGERSSQYAAESSCRLRFGPHTDWIGSFDIDEYMVPMGGYTSISDVLTGMDEEGFKILSFQSMRAWPRLNLLEDPKESTFTDESGSRAEECFHPKVRDDLTFLQTYNCDQEKLPKKKVMPAEKQFYRPDYVLLHFVHYSTVTTDSILSREEAQEKGIGWRKSYKLTAQKVANETDVATMLHTKSVVWDQTRKWKKTCKLKNPVCKVGFPFPEGTDRVDGVYLKNDDGFTYNCFINERIESFWVPKLEEALQLRPLPMESLAVRNKM